jgi:signal transduction histidine kinase
VNKGVTLRPPAVADAVASEPTRRLILVEGPEGQWPVIARALGRQGFTLLPKAESPLTAAFARALGLEPNAELLFYQCQNVGKIRRGRTAVEVPGRPESGPAPRPEEFTAGTLAAGVAHEINNPLAAVMANIDLALATVERLVQETTLPPQTAAADPAPAQPTLAELRAELTDARDAARHVRQIVRAVRDFCRPDEEAPETIDLREVVDLALRMASNELRARARLVKVYEAVPLVRTTALRLGQVFVNLLINAAQAIEAGRPEQHEIRILVRTDDRGWARVDITDTGTGIAPENLARVFIPFFTTKPAGVGSGLGLPICQRIVEELGGRIELQSQRGQGTTVTVSLPPAPQLP